MALAPVLTSAIAGMTFLLAAETAAFVQSVDATTDSEREDVNDASVGYDVGFIGYNFKTTGSVKGRASGGGSLAVSVPCAALTIANSAMLSANGVTAGGVYCNSVNLEHGEKAFRGFTTNFIKKPGIA